MKRIGLIAGNRRFPLLFLKEAKKLGMEVVVIGIKGDTAQEVKKEADKFFWINVEDFQDIAKIFKQENIQEAVMAGQVNPRHLFNKKLLNNKNIKSLLADVSKRQADAIFCAIADRLSKENIQLLDSTFYLSEHLVKEGVLTKCLPQESEWEDIRFGLTSAKAIGFLDIGQTVCVKNKTVIAVEAIEGTDATIRRAGSISRGGFIVVKTSKPNQDMRFDVPVVGTGTIRNLIRMKARCLAIEANKTLILDKEDCVRLADKFNISIIGV